MIGKLHGTVIDCKDPIELSKFYAEILGYTIVQTDSDWSVIGISEELPGIAFQKIHNYVAPSWPKGDIPTQIHFDIRVEDFDAAVGEIEKLGGALLSKSTDIFWVCADPEGHPFCIFKHS
jgi:predicted enzyme related to lactoylglutathione lyase